MVGNVAHMNRAQPCPPPQAGRPAMRRCYQHPLCDSAVLRCPGFWVRFHAGGNSTADLRRSPRTSFPAVSFLILLEAFIASQNASLICNHCPIIPVHFRFSFSVLTVLPPSDCPCSTVRLCYRPPSTSGIHLDRFSSHQSQSVFLRTQLAPFFLPASYRMRKYRVFHTAASVGTPAACPP